MTHGEYYALYLKARHDLSAAARITRAQAGESDEPQVEALRAVMDLSRRVYTISPRVELRLFVEHHVWVDAFPTEAAGNVPERMPFMWMTSAELGSAALVMRVVEEWVSGERAVLPPSGPWEAVLVPQTGLTPSGLTG